jgi:hypothetical protein
MVAVAAVAAAAGTLLDRSVSETAAEKGPTIGHGKAAALRPERLSGGSAPRNVISVLTRKVLSMALEELREEDMRRHVAENVIVPLLRVIMGELMPYAVIFSVIIAALLLMSALTLTLLAIFYFKPKNMRL